MLSITAARSASFACLVYPPLLLGVAGGRGGGQANDEQNADSQRAARFWLRCGSGQRAHCTDEGWGRIGVRHCRIDQTASCPHHPIGYFSHQAALQCQAGAASAGIRPDSHRSTVHRRWAMSAARRASSVTCCAAT